MAKKSFLVGFWTTISVISSTILVLLLKYFSRSVRCKYTTTLTAYHYMATWCVLELSAHSHYIRRTSNVPLRNRVYLAIFVLLSIYFNNSSLETNSIAFYQLSKLLCIISILGYNIFVKKIKPEKEEVTLLLVIIGGVFLFSISDMEYSFKGIANALLGIVSTSYAQILIGEYQKKYSLSGSELQLAIVPYEFVISIVFSLFLESRGEGNFMSYEFHVLDIVVMVSTCLVSTLVNISAFTLIGLTSPISFQVIGHIKTILVIIGASFLFPFNIDTFVQKMFAVIGAIVALVGSALYYKLRRDNITLDDGMGGYVDF